MGLSKFCRHLKICDCFPSRNENGAREGDRGPDRGRDRGRDGDRGRNDKEEEDDDNFGFEENDTGELKLEKVDLLISKNKKLHRTDMYQKNEDLIVRRGECFHLVLCLNDEYNKKTDTIILHCMSGRSSRARRSQGSRVFLSTQGNSDWKMEVIKGGKEVELAVTPRKDAIIGKYSLMVELLRKSGRGEPSRFKKMVEKTQLALLFNPFCKDDDVWMEDKKGQQEYVLNQNGCIYYSRYTGRQWKFGQFEENVLDCAFSLLERSKLSPSSKGNVVKVLRAFSALVNSNDDRGVLIGNWSGEYEGGTPPTTWNGSVKILQEYWGTNRSVRWGQCWVFAGVLTTVCRAVGIPCRPVTNGSSAHDTDASCTIDMYVDEDGEKISSPDSVWNFHVWNEAWCRRKDLPSEYQESGWQAFDATPQETSEGSFQCGPCPVKAICKGDIYIPYDGAFIFAEVNADRLWWKCTKDSRGRVTEMSISAVDRTGVGEYLSTKKIGENKVDDVTYSYKPRDKDKDREVVHNAVREAMSGGHSDISELQKAALESQNEETFDIKIRGKPEPNMNFSCEYTLTNKKEETREFVVSLSLSEVHTNGKPGAVLATLDKQTIKVGGKKEETNRWTVEAADYFSKVTNDAHLMIWAKANVRGSDDTMTRSYKYEFEKPDIKIKVASTTVKLGDEVKIELEFTNPTPVTLTGCHFGLEGPGISKTLNVSRDKKLKGHDTAKLTVSVRLDFPGDIIASFDSNELQGISGVQQLEINDIPA